MTSLEQHLAAHALYYDEDSADCNVCGCGWKIDSETLDYHGDTTTQIAELHATHVAATWREARTVRTVEEVEGLDMNALLLPLAPYSTVCDADDFLDDYDHNSEFCDDKFPMLVIWTPKDGAA